MPTHLSQAVSGTAHFLKALHHFIYEQQEVSFQIKNVWMTASWKFTWLLLILRKCVTLFGFLISNYITINKYFMYHFMDIRKWEHSLIPLALCLIPFLSLDCEKPFQCFTSDPSDFHVFAGRSQCYMVQETLVILTLIDIVCKSNGTLDTPCLIVSLNFSPCLEIQNQKHFQ